VKWLWSCFYNKQNQQLIGLNMNKFIYILFLFILISCKKDNIIEEFYQNGNLKMRAYINDNNEFDGTWEEYYESGELLFKTFYTKGKSLDTAYFYFKNKKIKEKGLLNNQQRVGWWINYDSDGFLNKKTEYKIINNKSHLNQYISFQRNGDTILDESFFVKLNIPDTLKKGRNICKLNFFSDIKDKKYFLIMVENRMDNNEIVIDTFPQEQDFSRFGIYASKRGKLNVKGIIDENYFEISNKSNDSSFAIQKSRKLYFETEVYVK